MNKEKISAQDIIDSLAAYDGMTKRLAEDFFKALISTVEETLLQKDSVKIKGLGTFKLKWLAPRKSVNVQTGEDIQLAGYYKVDFAPDNELKTLVNKPFEHLEAVILDEDTPVKKESESEDNVPNSLAEQAEEIKDLLSEIKSMKEDDKVVSTENKTVAEKKSDTSDVVNKIEKPAEETSCSGETKEEDVSYIKIDDAEIQHVRKKRTGLWISLSVLLVFIIVFFGLFFYNWTVNQWVNTHILKQNTPDIENTVVKEEPVEAEEPAEDNWQEIFNNRLQNQEYIETIKAQRGVHLAQFSEKYYGSPHFWVYIYEVNQSTLNNPDVIAPGMEIKIPKIDKRLIDLNDPRNVEKALELKTTYSK